MISKADIYNFYLNLSIKYSKERIVIFQSDDWGSQRMPSKSIYDKLSTQNWLNIEACPYTRNDSLENEFDLDRLFNVLLSFKDSLGNNPSFTMNMNMFNPDISKIRDSNFELYYDLNLLESYKKYNRDKVFSKLIAAKDENLIDLQYHGKQHLHPGEYLNLLKSNKVIRKASQYDFCSLSFENSLSITSPYLATYHPNFESSDMKREFLEGLNYMSMLFKVKPTSFIAPVYAMTDEFEDFSVMNGCFIIQGLIRKKLSLNNSNQIRTNNKHDRFYHIRNVSFEPSTDLYYNWIDRVLKAIKVSFLLNRPVVISTHRLNYISSISSKNADFNLRLLETLLKKIIFYWPDVKFLKTSEYYA